MDRLGYTAMTAANRTMSSLEVRANNLANVNTPGFRADLERAEAATVEGYGYDSRHMARVKNNGVDLTPGPITVTGRTLDLAIQGAGLFAVEHAGGEAYTRHGSLVINNEQQLTINGRPLLGDDGPIELPDFQSIHIGTDGTVSVLPQGETLMVEVGRIRTVDPQGVELAKNEHGLIVTTDGQPLADAVTDNILSGHLEMSNVSVIEELIASMSLNRTFETQIKMMKAAETLSDAGNRMIRGS
ncbi:MAG: flagellar basal body rod protein FlgF [Cellvibrio sp.]